MNRHKSSVNAFWALVRAGLWGKEAHLESCEGIDWQEVYGLASEQSVLGLVLSGLELSNLKPSQALLLRWIGDVQAIERQNKAMNSFIRTLFCKLHENGVDSVLIKGQGVAQCYERPLWRSPGDVDLLLNKENYLKGKEYIEKLTNARAKEYDFSKEYRTTISDWTVELHGSLRSGLSKEFNRGVDVVQDNICNLHQVRFWEIEGISIPLPETNNDILLVFTHFIKHFYKGELGIRQICDWCRLLWKYRDSIDVTLLDKYIGRMGLRAQWRGFAAFAVDYLGMPPEAMPFYYSNNKWSKKADKISSFVLDAGNFGKNIDRSYYAKYPLLIRKIISMWKRVVSLLHHATIFPWHTFLFMPHVIYTGIKATIENGSGNC